MWLAVSCQVTQIIIYYYTALLQFSHSHPQYYTPRALTSREASLLKTIFSFFIFRSSDIFGPVWNFLAVKTQAYNNLVFMFSFFVIFQEKSSLFISGRPGSPCVEAEQRLPATPLAKRLSKRKQLFRCLVLQTDELFESGNLFLWRIVPWCDGRYHPPRGLTLWLGPHAQSADDEHQSHFTSTEEKPEVLQTHLTQHGVLDRSGWCRPVFGSSPEYCSAGTAHPSFVVSSDREILVILLLLPPRRPLQQQQSTSPPSLTLFMLLQIMRIERDNR